MIEQLEKLMTKIFPTLDFSVSLGICAGIVLVVLLLISLAISAGCKITRYRKQLMASTKLFGGQSAITDENVQIVYDEVEKHPDGVQKGWAAFMDQRIGYPSDYITNKEVLGAREFSGKGAVAKVFLIILGIAVCAFAAVVGFMSVEFSDGMNVLNVVSALEFLIIPVAVYVICLLILDIAFNRKIRRLGLNFISFCEMLDAKIVVSDKEEREFISDNLEDINRRVEELIAGRMDEDEVIEVITAPKVEDMEEVEATEFVDDIEIKKDDDFEMEIKKEEPVEEIVKFEQITPEEKENYFKVLVDLVDRALADESCDEDDYALIAATIYDEAVDIGAIDNPEEMEIFEECFRKLAERINA